MSYEDAKKEIIRRYGKVNAGAKSYVASRFALGHYQLVLPKAPQEGLILDYGCGYGQLSMLLRLTGERRTLHSYEICRERAELAAKAAAGLSRIKFHHDAGRIPDGAWNAVFFYDMLHYIPKKEQDALVTEFAKKIVPGGTLVIRDVNRRPFSPRYLFNSTQERIMVGAGLTLTKVTRRVHFRNIADFLHIVGPLGFECRISSPPWHHPYADYLFVAKKHS